MPLLGSIRCILSHVTASGYTLLLTFLSLYHVLYSDECGMQKTLLHVERMLPLFVLLQSSAVPKDYVFSVEVREEADLRSKATR